MAKLNGNGKWVITSVVGIVAICLTVAGVILTAGGKLAKIETVELYASENKEEIKAIKSRVSFCETIDAGREKDIEYIKKQLEQIETVNTQVLEYLRTSHNVRNP